ncbi:MAG: DUF433 domain-containing protein [Kineosporiaceae bacterium]
METTPGDLSVLGRSMYSEALAARLLRVPQGTLHYWLEGGDRRGRTYLPVLRRRATGRREVTWAEFVEAGLLRSYRRDREVPMRELRAFIEYLRDRLGVPYPLAHHQPLTSGRELVVEAQRESGLDPEYWLILPQGRQLLYSPATDQFLQRVTWSSGPHGFVTTWRPHDDPNSPVRIDPEVRFGRPQIGGISTEALWDEAAGGAAPDEIAQAFGLDENDVWWALQYERTHRRRTPTAA